MLYSAVLEARQLWARVTAELAVLAAAGIGFQPLCLKLGSEADAAVAVPRARRLDCWAVCFQPSARSDATVLESRSALRSGGGGYSFVVAGGRALRVGSFYKLAARTVDFAVVLRDPVEPLVSEIVAGFAVAVVVSADELRQHCREYSSS